MAEVPNKTKIQVKFEDLSKEDLIKQVKKHLILMQKLKSKCDEYTGKCQNIEMKYDEVVAGQNEQQEYIEKLSKENASLQKKILTMSEDIQCMEMKEKTMTAGFQSVLEEVTSIREEKEKLVHQIILLTRAREEAVLTLKTVSSNAKHEMEESQKKHEFEMAQLRSHNFLVLAEKDAMETRLREIKTELASFALEKRQHEGIVEELDTARNTVNELQRENAEKLAELDSANRLVTTLKEQIEKLHVSKQDAENSCHLDDDAMEILEDKVDELKNLCENLNEELERANSDRYNLQLNEREIISEMHSIREQTKKYKDLVNSISAKLNDNKFQDLEGPELHNYLDLLLSSRNSTMDENRVSLEYLTRVKHLLDKLKGFGVGEECGDLEDFASAMLKLEENILTLGEKLEDIGDFYNDQPEKSREMPGQNYEDVSWGTEDYLQVPPKTDGRVSETFSDARERVNGERCKREMLDVASTQDESTQTCVDVEDRDTQIELDFANKETQSEIFTVDVEVECRGTQIDLDVTDKETQIDLDVTDKETQIDLDVTDKETQIDLDVTDKETQIDLDVTDKDTQIDLDVTDKETQVDLDVTDKETQSEISIVEHSLIKNEYVDENTQTLQVDVMNMVSQTWLDVDEKYAQTYSDVDEKYAQTLLDMGDKSAQTQLDIDEKYVQTELDMGDNYTQEKYKVNDKCEQTWLEVEDKDAQTLFLMEDKDEQIRFEVEHKDVQTILLLEDKDVQTLCQLEYKYVQTELEICEGVDAGHNKNDESGLLDTILTDSYNKLENFKRLAVKAKQESDDLKKQITELLVNVATLTEDKKLRQTTLAQYEEECATHRDNLRTLQGEHKLLQDNLQGQKEETECCRQDFSRILSERNAVQVQLANVREENDSLNLRVSTLESEKESKYNNVISLEIEDYERLVKDLNAKIKDFQQEIKTLKSELQMRVDKVGELQREIAEVENQKVQTGERAEKMKVLLIKCKRELSENMKNVKIQREAYEELQSKNEITQREAESCKIQVSDLSSELLGAKEKMRTITESNVKLVSRLESKITSLQEKLTSIQHDYETCQAEYNSYKVRVHSVLKQQKNSPSPDSSRSEDPSEKERQEKLVQHLQLKVQELMSKLEEANAEREIGEESHDRLQQRHNKLVQQLESNEVAWSEKLRQLDDEKDNALKENQKYVFLLREQINAVNSANTETLNQLKISQGALIDIQQRLEIAKAENAKIRQERSAAQRDEEVVSVVNMERQEGEGSEMTGESELHNAFSPLAFMPLEQLIDPDRNTDDVISNSSTSVADVAKLENKLGHATKKIDHLAEVLHESEATNARLSEQARVLKEEIRRLERNQERERHAANMEYLKNVIVKFFSLQAGSEREQLVAVLKTMLRLSRQEEELVMLAAKGSAVAQSPNSSWSSYLPTWSNLV